MTSKIPHPGPLIREVRTRKDLSLEEVAEAVGTSAATVSRIENQKSRGSTDNLEKIAAFLEIDPRLLVVGDLAALDPHDPTAPDPEPEGEPVATGRRAGLVKPYTVMSFYDAPNVRGPLAGEGPNASPDAADIARALKYQHLHRGSESGHKEVEVSQIPPKTLLLGLLSPLEVKIGGVVALYLPSGWCLVVQPGAARTL